VFSAGRETKIMFKSIAGTGALLIVAFCIGVAAAPGDQTTAPVLKGSAAFGGFDQDRPGLRRLIQPQDLAPVTLSTTASAQGATRPDGVIPKVPEGLSHRASPGARAAPVAE
jgi:hypothetical protein